MALNQVAGGVRGINPTLSWRAVPSPPHPLCGGTPASVNSSSRCNGFQVRWSSCYLFRLVLSGAVLYGASCYLVRLVLSCIVLFCLHHVCRQPHTGPQPGYHGVRPTSSSAPSDTRALRYFSSMLIEKPSGPNSIPCTLVAHMYISGFVDNKTFLSSPATG